MRQINKFAYIENERPALIADIRGGAAYPGIRGLIHMYWLPDAILLQSEFEGLSPSRVFGFHVHSGIICGTEDGAEPFAEAGSHFDNCGEGLWCGQHPYHAGDLPPVFSDSSGYAAGQVYIDKATVAEYSGKPVVLHMMPDDFSSQPAGNSGMRIACGILAENL